MTFELLLKLAWIPFVTAFIGWLTNWVAIKMLFHPRKALNVLGISIQGLIPKRQDELANKIADVIERELLNAHTISQQLEKVDFNQYMAEFANRLVHQGLGARLKTIPLVGNMINDSTLKMLEQMAVEAMAQEIPQLKKKIAGEIESKLEIREIVHQKIAELELPKLEELVTQVAKKEFKAIEILGGVLGFVVGCVQLGILLVIQ